MIDFKTATKFMGFRVRAKPAALPLVVFRTSRGWILISYADPAPYLSQFCYVGLSFERCFWASSFVLERRFRRFSCLCFRTTIAMIVGEFAHHALVSSSCVGSSLLSSLRKTASKCQLIHSFISTLTVAGGCFLGKFYSCHKDFVWSVVVVVECARALGFRRHWNGSSMKQFSTLEAELN